MAKQDCCPDPQDIWLFRMIRRDGVGGPVFTYTVPEHRILIVNSWVASQVTGGLPLDLLRNAEIVATVTMDNQGIINQLFPTGIVFFAGDTLTLDLTNRGANVIAYGYLQKA